MQPTSNARLALSPTPRTPACILLVSLLGILGPGCEDSHSGAWDGHEAGSGDAAPPLDARRDAADAGPNRHVIEIPGTGVYDNYGYSNDGFIAAYAENRGGDSIFVDVYYFDVVEMVEHQITDRPKGQGFPYVYDRMVAFDDTQRYDAATDWYQRDIFLFNIATGTERQLTDSPFSKFEPVMNQEFLLHYTKEGCSNINLNRLHLMRRDTLDATVVSECGYSAETISISDHYAAWTARLAPGGWPKVIHVRDLAAGLTFTPDPNVDVMQFFPHTDIDHVIWQDSRHGRRELFLFTTSTGELEWLTPDPWEQAWPTLRDGLVAWSDYRHSQEWGEGGSCDIYVYDLATHVERRVTRQSRLYQARFVDSGWLLYGERIPFTRAYKLYMHDLVGDGILSTDGHVIPEQ